MFYNFFIAFKTGGTTNVASTPPITAVTICIVLKIATGAFIATLLIAVMIGTTAQFTPAYKTTNFNTDATTIAIPQTRSIAPVDLFTDFFKINAYTTTNTALPNAIIGTKKIGNGTTCKKNAKKGDTQATVSPLPIPTVNVAAIKTKFTALPVTTGPNGLVTACNTINSARKIAVFTSQRMFVFIIRFPLYLML